MTDPLRPVDGPYSIGEIRRKLDAGEINRNTYVNMADGDRWILLTSFVASPHRSQEMENCLELLRRRTAYREARWMITLVALLLVAVAVGVFWNGFFLSLLFEKPEWGFDTLIARIWCGSLLLIAAALFRAFAVMVVDSLDCRIHALAPPTDVTRPAPRPE